MNRDVFSSLLEILGFAAVLTAVFLFDWRAGIGVAGLCVVLVGWMLGREVSNESSTPPRQGPYD